MRGRSLGVTGPDRMLGILLMFSGDASGFWRVFFFRGFQFVERFSRMFLNLLMIFCLTLFFLRQHLRDAWDSIDVLVDF